MPNVNENHDDFLAMLEDYLPNQEKRVEGTIESMDQSFKNKTVLEGEIVKRIKGGYIVQALFHQGFLPNSLSEISEKEEKVNGKKVSVIVKDIKEDSKRNKKITYSVKDIKLAAQEKVFSNLREGQVVDCTVTEVLDFGLAVDIDGVKGFIHISEVSWKRLDNLAAEYKVGQQIKAVVVSLDEDKRNLKLSIKKLGIDPWSTVAEKFAVGDVVDGVVTRVLNYGAFVEIATGVEGLVHISDFSWTKKKVNVSEYVKEGETIKVNIVELHPEERKLKLGIKQLVANPWENAEEAFGVGQVVKAKVVEVKQFGIFAEITDGVDVFVHVSDYNWLGEEVPKFKVGDEVEVKITELDLKEKKIKGSIKALRKSPWEHALEEYKVGLTVERKIKTVADFGLFIELTKGIDGFIPTQFASKDFIKDIKEKCKEGDIVKAQIVEVNKDTQKIKLSIKKIELEEKKREEREQIEKYSTSSSEE